MSRTDIFKDWIHSGYVETAMKEIKKQESFEASQNNEAYKKYAMSKKASYKRKIKRGKRK